jgi:hypothetical protein
MYFFLIRRLWKSCIFVVCIALFLSSVVNPSISPIKLLISVYHYCNVDRVCRTGVQHVRIVVSTGQALDDGAVEMTLDAWLVLLSNAAGSWSKVGAAIKPARSSWWPEVKAFDALCCACFSEGWCCTARARTCPARVAGQFSAASCCPGSFWAWCMFNIRQRRSAISDSSTQVATSLFGCFFSWNKVCSVVKMELSTCSKNKSNFTKQSPELIHKFHYVFFELRLWSSLVPHSISTLASYHMKRVLRWTNDGTILKNLKYRRKFSVHK